MAGLIAPLDEARERLIRDETARFIRLASGLYGRDFAPIPVHFDLVGRSAGMYRVRGRQRMIRYNPHLCAKYFDDSLAVTVPHEVAHYVTDVLHGLRNIRPHGAEWKAVMQAFGADDSRTCNYDLRGVPHRAERRHAYRCDCRVHQLSARRHNQMQRQGTRYVCRSCRVDLVPL